MKKDENKSPENEEVHEDPTVLNDEYEFGGGGDVDEEKQSD